MGLFELLNIVLSTDIKEIYNTLGNPNSELHARLIRQNIEVEEIRIINEALQK